MVTCENEEARYRVVVSNGRHEIVSDTTGDKSVRNIRLYDRLGYRTIRAETLSPKVTLVFMEKRGGTH